MKTHHGLFFMPTAGNQVPAVYHMLGPCKTTSSFEGGGQAWNYFVQITHNAVWPSAIKALGSWFTATMVLASLSRRKLHLSGNSDIWPEPVCRISRKADPLFRPLLIGSERLGAGHQSPSLGQFFNHLQIILVQSQPTLTRTSASQYPPSGLSDLAGFYRLGFKASSTSTTWSRFRDSLAHRHPTNRNHL